jgi:hypothetical protein
MHKKLYKIIITIITLFLLSVFLFAFINILSMKANIQREIDAYSEMFKAQGDKPEQIATTLNAVRIGREKEIGSSTIQLVSIIILAITAGILLWYSYETKRLADLTAKQIKINIKPIIIVNSISNYCRLKNIGKSPALNITVRDVVRTDNNSNKKYIFKFTEIPVCGSEEEQGTGITPHCNGNSITASGDVDNLVTYFLHYNSLVQGQDYELIIDYEDVEKGKWRSISIVDNKGVHFKEVTELS